MAHRIGRSAYIELVGARLIEIQGKAYIVTEILRNEITNGNSCDREQLRLSELQVEQFMLTVCQRLDDLKAAEDENWELAKYSFDCAWEDVARSIRNAVARFS